VIALLVMTDGRRDCIARTIPSALAQLDGSITRRIIHDDSGDTEYRAWLMGNFPTFEIVGPPHGRSGFGGAISSAWDYIATNVEEPFVFHLEDDFTFNRSVDLTDMAVVLDLNPHIVQVALRRQPWNPEEREAGGIVELHPGDYKDCRVGGMDFLTHRRFFTTNPSLYRRKLCEQPWPNGCNSEGRFSIDLFTADPAACSAFFGARDSGEWVTHIGNERIGTGY
jgi:hypothetical protein